MIALICGSPKAKNSAADELLSLIDKDLIYTDLFRLRGDKPDDEMIKKMLRCKKLIFSFPLYVDGIPSHMLRWMERVAEIANGVKRKVYCIVNCGFYEGRQGRIALDIMKNFCRQCGFEYCGGIGMGSGGMTRYIARIPMNIGPKGKLNNALRTLCRAAAVGKCFEDMYFTVGISRKIYKTAAERAFRVAAKRNGARL